jgi:UDP-3-O-[3-hydroxymyristoyl] glucosamine N-acyltransferase
MSVAEHMMAQHIASKWQGKIHPTATIHGDVRFDDETTIGPYCTIGSEHGSLELSGATIRAYSTIEGGSEIGPGLETGQYTFIRAGNKIGTNLRLGSYSSLEGGATIGDYVRFGGRCEMTLGTLGDFVRLYVGSVITDNPLPPSTIREPVVVNHGAVLCANSTVRGGVTIGLGAFIGGGAFVSRDVPDAMFYERSGKTEKFVNELTWADTTHPWTDHFKDDYPEEAWARIDDLNSWIKGACR